MQIKPKELWKTLMFLDLASKKFLMQGKCTECK